jgi:hypothetical protein
LHAFSTISLAPLTKSLFWPPPKLIIIDILFLADEKGNFSIASYYPLISSYLKPVFSINFKMATSVLLPFSAGLSSADELQQVACKKRM